MAGARQVVDPPQFTPAPFSLLTAVEWVPSNDPHWMQGITYEPNCPNTMGAATFDDCISVTGVGGAPPPEAALANTLGSFVRAATPFTVYAEFDCSTVGNDQAQAKATNALAQAEAWQVERAFWSGVAANQTVVFPHLAANAAITETGGTLLQSAAVDVSVTGTGSPGVGGDFMNPATALGLLEQALANCYGGVGVIHVPAVALPSIAGMLDISGPRLVTKRGTIVAVGGGYPGTSPAGVARPTNTAWMYATGKVFGYRSAVRIRAPQGAAALDRATNTMRMIADRTYVIGWDCCHFAVPMALGVPKGT